MPVQLELGMSEKQIINVLYTLEVAADAILKRCYEADPVSIDGYQWGASFSMNDTNIIYTFDHDKGTWSFPIEWLFDDALVTAHINKLKLQREERNVRAQKLREQVIIDRDEYQKFKEWQNEKKNLSNE